MMRVTPIMPSAYPSAFDLDTRVLPISPPAPERFSMKNRWP
jgi:hypothetical protein